MTLENFTAEIEAEEAAARAKAVASIKPYDVERSNEATAQAAKDGHGHVLREWLKTHPDETELVDEEWNLRAFMQNGGRTRNYDTPAAIKARNPRLYVRLEELGLFRLDDAAVQLALKEGLITHGDLEGFVHEGERTPTLQVKAR